MTTVNATVTKGYTWVYDAEGKLQLTKDRLNLAALPTVTVELSDELQTADIKDEAVTLAKLADAVQDLICKVTGTATDDGNSDTASVSLQLQDAEGNTLADVVRMRVWISASSYGAPTAKFTSGSEINTGTELYEYLAQADYDVISDANGVVDMDITNGGSGTLYVMAEVNGTIYPTTVTIA